MKAILPYRLPALLLLFALPATMNAVTYYWRLNSAASWTTFNAWSLTSGGPGLGATYPSAGADIAIFNGSGTGSCAITTNFGIGSIQMNAGYTGVLSNSGFSNTLGSNFSIASGTFTLNSGLLVVLGTFTQTAGTFNGSNGTMMVAGNFSKTGGTFMCSSNETEFRGNVSITSTGSFSHNNGVVIFGGTTQAINCTVSFATVMFWPAAASTTATITGTLTAMGDVRLLGTGTITLNGGIIDTQNGVLCNNSSTTGGGTATIRLFGNSSNPIVGLVPAGQCKLPNVTVAMNGGTFGITGTPTVAGNFIYDPPGTSGCAVNHGAGAVLNMSGAAALLTPYDAAVTLSYPILTLCDLTVMTSAIITLGSVTEIRNLILQPLSILDVSANNHTLYVSGNWTNQSTSASSFTQRSGLVQMISGSITSSVTGGETFYDFRMQNPAGASIITLNSRLNITHYLRDEVTFGLNQILNTASSPLMFMDNAYMFYSDPAWMSLVVTGPVMKMGNDAFSFPVGVVTVSGVFSRPLSMSAPATSPEIFTAQYYYNNSDALYPHANRDPAILTLSECEYWNFTRSGGFSAVYVTASFWNTSTPSCQVLAPADLIISRWQVPTSFWFNYGQSAFTYNSGLGTVTSSIPVTDYGIFTIGSRSMSNPLPVTLVDFDATASVNYVSLGWVTSSETNNDYFVVERSADGATIESLDTIDGNGTTSEEHHYTSADESPLEGLSYYRIKQVDFNGGYSYSEWKSIEMSPVENISVYPNPTNGELHLNLPGENDVLWTMTITSITGQTVIERKASKDELREVRLDLAPGTFLLQIVSTTALYSEKLVITE